MLKRVLPSLDEHRPTGQGRSRAEAVAHLQPTSGQNGLAIRAVIMKDWVKTTTTLVLCAVECLILGGTIFGWPSLAYIYKDQGLFSCHHNETQMNGTQTCADQDLYLPLALTVGVIAFGLPALPLGWAFDRYGLRVVRTAAFFSGVVGSLFLAFATARVPYLIYPGTFFTGAANIIIIITNSHVALLGEKRASVITLIYMGFVNSGGIVFFLVKMAYEYGISQRWLLIGLACSWTLVLLTSFCLLPPFKVYQDHKGSPEEETLTTKVPDVDGDTKILSPHNGHTSEDKGKAVKSLRHFICSFWFIIHLIYLNVVHVWAMLIIGIMSTWLSDVYGGDKTLVSRATNIYAYIQVSCGILFSPFAGALIDVMRHYLQDKIAKKNSWAAPAIVTVPNLLGASLSYLLVAVFILAPQPYSPYAVSISSEVGRSFLYGTFVAYLLIVFPPEHFGVLYGVTYTVTVLTMALQYGYLQWVELSGYTPMVSFMLGAMVLSLIHPISILVNFLLAKNKDSDVLLRHHLKAAHL